MNAKLSRRTQQQNIAAKLRREITTGHFPIGSQIPTEDELCALFKASRYSVREALRSLTDEGLIARRPRVGSVVTSSTPAERFVQSVPTMQKLLNYPSGTIRTTIGTGYVKASRELAKLLKCGIGDRWFRIRALRYALGSATPLCYTDIYIRPKYAKIMNHPQHKEILVSDQIKEMFGVVTDKTTIEISASHVKASIASILSVEPKSPALVVVRRYTDINMEDYEVSIAVHPANRYTYAFEYQRQR